MRWLLAPFYDREARRVRALVRVALSMGLFAALSVPIQVAFTHAYRVQSDRWIMHGALHIVTGLVVVFATWVSCRVLDHRALTDLGLRLGGRWLLDAGFGVALGGLLMLGILGAERALDWARFAPVGPLPDGTSRLLVLPVAVLSFVVIAVMEELLFRGYQLVNLGEGFRCRRVSPAAALLAATLVSSIVFGAFHLMNPNASPVAAGNIALAGGMLAAAFLLTGELGLPIGLHFGWNFFQNLFGMPVSGQSRFFYAALLRRTEAGPDWITGGAFGPEAGVTGLVAIVVGTAAVFLYARAVEGRVRIHPSLLEGVATPTGRPSPGS